MDGDIIHIVKRTGRHSGQPFNQDILFNQTVLFGCTFIILFLFPDEQRYFSQRHRTQKYSSEVVVKGTFHLTVPVLETASFKMGKGTFHSYIGHTRYLQVFFLEVLFTWQSRSSRHPPSKWPQSPWQQLG